MALKIIVLLGILHVNVDINVSENGCPGTVDLTS